LRAEFFSAADVVQCVVDAQKTLKDKHDNLADKKMTGDSDKSFQFSAF